MVFVIRPVADGQTQLLLLAGLVELHLLVGQRGAETEAAPSEALAGALVSPLKPVTRIDDQYWITGAAGVSPHTPAHPAAPLPGGRRPRSRRSRSCTQRRTNRQAQVDPFDHLDHLNQARTYNSSIPSAAMR